MPRGIACRDAWLDRMAWREHSTPGRSRVFLAGETVRCVGPFTTEEGNRVACGFLMGTVKPNARVIIRVRRPNLSPMPHLGKDVTCPDCHTALEEFVLAADAPRLEATG